MSPQLILYSFLAYTLLLFLVSWITSKKSGNDAFFLGERKSPWFVVAYGMIGASLSGVTFISIPGWVGGPKGTQFSYLMVVLGYVVGYYSIAYVLLPMYYKLKLTSIYTYLEYRFGAYSYKTGSFYFLLSRVIGASFRMFLVVNVLQIFVFDAFNIPFYVTVIVFMLLIILYTYRGGIKTIVWTDTLQTTFMLLAVFISVFIIQKSLNISFGEMISQIKESDYSKVIFTDWQSKKFFLKQFFSGAFIAIVMTGLDQDMMQKNLSCRNLKDARKNVISLGWILVPVNLIFLCLGVILYFYANFYGIDIPDMTDDLFPAIALQYLGPLAGIVFIIGLISAAYSSADSALTALTTSFSVDILGIDKKYKSERKKIRIRKITHFSIATVLIMVIIGFRLINDQAVIQKLFTIAGYTYGPLLGLFAFGLFTNFKIKDKYVPIVAIVSPIFSYLFSITSKDWLWGYKVGFELLILNGFLMFMGLLIISLKPLTNNKKI